MTSHTSRLRTALSTFVAATAGFAQAAVACTGIMLSGSDGTNVRARTMEWGAFDLQSAISIIPPGYEMSSIMDDGSAGATWTTQYGAVAITGLGRLVATDGMNEAGLSGGLFYLPGFAEYPEYDPSHDGPSISPADFLTYALGNFATVAEVREVIDAAGIGTNRPGPYSEGPRRAGDATSLVSGSTRAGSELGWSPENSTLETMIRDAWRWSKTGSYRA